MAPTLSKLVSRNRIIGAVSAAALIWILRMRRKQNKRTSIQYVVGEKSPQKIKAHDLFLLKWGFLLLIAMSLISRTFCDIWLIHNATYIENAIVTMDRKLFISKITVFLAAMPLISVVNNILKYSIGEAKIRFRTRLTHHLYEQYLRNSHYEVYSLSI
ncbi:hypothetical protein L9F63_006853, partial [Diploptera punctata]